MNYVERAERIVDAYSASILSLGKKLDLTMLISEELKQTARYAVDLALFNLENGVCFDHPKYTGTRKPRTDCPMCHYIHKKGKNS